jgi:pyruvate dehydrogenase E2 component (dihydrolipoamide acetyltransferase)
MPVGVVMPALEMAQDTGTLVSWFKNEGDRVTKGERLLQIETDKAVVEIEATADGILAGVTAKPGDVVPVGRTIAWLVSPGETLPSAGREERAADPSVAPAAGGAVPAHTTRAAPAAPDKIRMSPKARRLAREHQLDVTTLRGSGPEREILAEDVLAAVPSPARATDAPGGPASEFDVVSSVGRKMAERTAKSWAAVPHFFVTREMDAGSLVRAHDRLNAQIERPHEVKITYTDLVIAAVAYAIGRHPRLNASWTDKGILLNRDVNIALATAVDDAVVTVVLRDIDVTKPGDLAIRRHRLVDRARASQLGPADISGGTFTISNLGMFGVDAFTAIIVPPQAAILAVGAIVDRVVPVQGRPGIRPMMSLTLGCDHRVVDGARGAAFLRDLVATLAEPERWLG